MVKPLVLVFRVVVIFHLFTAYKESFQKYPIVLRTKTRIPSKDLKHSLLFGSFIFQFSSVQSLSHVRLFANPWITACQAFLSITNSRSLLKLMSIESVMPSSHLILCCPVLLLPPTLPSISVFSSESTLRMRWPKYWSFSFNISPSNEHPELTSFRMDWLDLLAVQGTLKSLLQHHSSKASILRHSAFFTVQLSHPYMTTGKTIALTRQTFVDKVMFLLFNMLSRFNLPYFPPCPTTYSIIKPHWIYLFWNKVFSISWNILTDLPFSLLSLLFLTVCFSRQFSLNFQLFSWNSPRKPPILASEGDVPSWYALGPYPTPATKLSLFVSWLTFPARR